MTVQPLCAVFGECGGCAYQDIPYEQELRHKEGLVKELLQKNPGITADLFEPIVASPKPYHYRNRLDLQFVRTRDDRVLLGFTPSSPAGGPGAGRGIVPVESCSIAETTISEFLQGLRKRLEQSSPLKYRRANIVVRTGDDAKVLWGGIGKRSCRMDPDDYFWMNFEGKRIFYSLDTFFQANLSILPKLLERIAAFDCWPVGSLREQTKPVLYDLYAGVGLFSLALADKTRRSILIEESPSSVKLAEHNVRYNRLTHIEILAGRMEDVFAPLLAREPDGEAPKVAIVDPPRAGLSPRALEALIHAKQFTCLFYLSCDPHALARDIKKFIEQGWTVEKIAPFAFFPKSRHVETLVLLTRDQKAVGENLY